MSDQPIQINQRQAALLRKFLQRTRLDGWEVPEFLEAVRALNVPLPPGVDPVDTRSEPPTAR